jgi:anti-anti-sigma factor
VGRDLETELIHLDGQAVLAVRGEIDAWSSVELGQACRGLASLTDRLVLDFAAVTFMDSSGLRALLEVSQIAGLVSVVVRGAAGQVRRVFEITALADQFLEPIDDAQSAVAPDADLAS